MAGLSESTFLADISKWAVQGHIDFVNECNESMRQLSDHINTTIGTNSAVDRDGATSVRAALDPVTTVSV